MAMTVLSAILGLFSPLVFVLGWAPFQVRGTTSLKEVLAASHWLSTSRSARVGQLPDSA